MQIDTNKKTSEAVQTDKYKSEVEQLTNSQLSISELIALFDQPNKHDQYKDIIAAFLRNDLTIKIKKTNRFSKCIEEDMYISLANGCMRHEPNLFFRFLEQLPEITLLTDAILGADKRFKGYHIIIRTFKDEKLLQFLDLCQATLVEKIVLISLLHIFLRSNKTSIDASELFIFIPKSYYVNFLFFLNVGCTLVDQKLISYNTERFSNELVFYINQRVMQLLSGYIVEHISN